MLEALQRKDYWLILNTVPRSIKDVIECPPVQQLVNSGAKLNDLEACLAVEITKTANMLTVGGNLRQGQSLDIARSLIAEFPGESLQDFCLCLRNGLKGNYGDIYRFDILIISGWFKQYLQEKYEAIERKLMQEKDDMYKPIKTDPTNPDKHQMWIDRLKEAVGSNEIIKKVPPITDEDVEQEGQERPKASFHPSSPKSIIDKHERHIQYVRENYDLYTGDKLPTWISEEEWIKKQNQLP